ncbi:substrate-binding domain-containing protein [bacterium]|nr:substrate-binding domain-containing protein [bacterium]
MPTTRTIGVTLDPTRAGHRHRAMWLGICRYAEEHDWRLVLDPFADGKPAAPYDGAISHINPWRQKNPPCVPAVYLAPFWKSHPTSQVTPDYRHAGRLAARHLIERDYDSFAVFGGNRDRPAYLQMEAFRQVVRRKGGRLDSMLFSRRRPHTRVTWPRFAAVLDDWFGKAELPVGIFAAGDLLARRLADACARAGLRVPEDVGIVGSGNDPVICEQPAPALTSIDLDDETVGYRAAATLDELLDAGARGTITRKVAPLGLVPRRSTDRRFFDDPLVSAALGWIARHCHEPIRVGHVAEGIGVPAWKLRRLMRRARRHTVVHAIAQARVRRAMALLESTDLGIEPIATRAGYTGLHAMDGAFREHLHTTPRAFRDAASAGDSPPSSPIVYAKQLLRETTWSVPRIALVTGYGTDDRLNTAFRRHTGTSPGIWRSIHGTAAVRRRTADPAPPWPGITVTFYDQDGKEME